MNIEISIIIRTKNEEDWIGICLRNIKKQSFKNYEVVIVDNNSSDFTVNKAKAIMPNVIICDIENYKPGKALNLGIENSKGKFIVCLSAHCIPTNENWLETLYNEIRLDEEIAGVYGRQLPTDQTLDIDRRDMFLVFGLDKKVQYKDPFFHNANSIIRKSIWEKCPFDDEIDNIEDRIWGQAIINVGYKLVYTPDACVYHMLGINQTSKNTRYKNIARLIKETSPDIKSISLEEYKIISIIPILSDELNNELKLKVFIDTVSIVLKMRNISNIVLTSDKVDQLKKVLKHNNIKSSLFLFHQREFKQKRILDIYNEVINYLKNRNIFSDIVLTANISYPFKSRKVMERCIIELIKNDVDAVIPVYTQMQPIWVKMKEDYVRVDDYETPNKNRKPVYIGLENHCIAAFSNKIRGLENFFDNKIEMVMVKNPYYKFHIDDLESIGEYNAICEKLKLS